MRIGLRQLPRSRHILRVGREWCAFGSGAISRRTHFEVPVRKFISLRRLIRIIFSSGDSGGRILSCLFTLTALANVRSHTRILLPDHLELCPAAPCHRKVCSFLGDQPSTSTKIFKLPAFLSIATSSPSSVSRSTRLLPLLRSSYRTSILVCGAILNRCFNRSSSWANAIS